MTARSAALEALKADLSARGLLGIVEPRRIPSGHPALDAAVGGWPRPGVVEVAGLPGSGRLGVLLPSLARETRAGRVVAVVDALGRLHPPGLTGVAWSCLLLLRPGPDRAPWAAEQVLRSGAVPLVVLLDPAPFGRSGWRLLRAAEEGDAVLAVVAEAPDPGLPAALRLATRFQPGRGTLAVRLSGGRCVREGRVIEVGVRPPARFDGRRDHTASIVDGGLVAML
ncbi:MAG: hypothetical protein JXB39_16850 [Deltaproteobacteria bacterium]|nr:hypothetical protein [Deltaproteobacteria bacterium]